MRKGTFVQAIHSNFYGKIIDKKHIYSKGFGINYYVFKVKSLDGYSKWFRDKELMVV